MELLVVLFLAAAFGLFVAAAFNVTRFNLFIALGLASGALAVLLPAIAGL